MSDYGNCCLSDTGIHAIDYNKFSGSAYCIYCGYKLMLTKIDDNWRMSHKQWKARARLKIGVYKSK